LHFSMQHHTRKNSGLRWLLCYMSSLLRSGVNKTP
jgi:hypothetical protein